MPDIAENAASLVNVAAESIAATIAGCAGLISFSSAGSLPGGPDSPIPKAINIFGPRIIEAWRNTLNGKSRAEQLAALLGLADVPAAEGRRAAASIFDRVAANATPRDRELAVEYLAAIPFSIRRALIPDPETGKPTLPETVTSNDERALVRLLPTDVPPFPIGCELPGTTYQLEELLGIGGFGAVYKAINRCEQHQPPRAIKFCLDPSMKATLNRERAILDRLMAVDGSKWSQRIVRLYGYALDARPPFLVYEYVPGGDLTALVQAARQKTGRGFRPATALQLVRQICEALAFAHSQGMVHRDLKPANVLVSGSSVKLTDFGIGGVIASHVMRNSTIGGSVMSQVSAADHAQLFRGSGTPLYMSPEQRRGDQPDPRHDLYSLGVLWYQLLVGDVAKELHPGWPDELTEEFQTPKEHIDLIQRCVGYFKKRPANCGELITLLPGPAKPTMATAPAPAPAAKAAPAAPVAPQVDAAKVHAEAERAKLHRLLSDAIQRESFTQARDVVGSLLKMQADDTVALEARDDLDRRLSKPLTETHVFQEHSGWVRCVALAPEGRHGLSGGDDGVVLVYHVEGKRLLRRLTGHRGAVMSVALSPDGRRALSGSWDGTARFWDLTNGNELCRAEGGWTGVKCVACLPDGRRALLGCGDNSLRLWDLELNQELGCLEGHTDQIQSIALSPDGKRAVSGGDDMTLRLWDLEAGKELRRLTGHRDAVTSVAFASNNRWLLSGSSDRAVRMWDSDTGKELRRFEGHADWVNAVTFTPDARRIVTGSGGEMVDGQFQHGNDLTVRVWDIQSEREINRFEGHEASVTSLACGAGGRVILSGGLDQTVRVLTVPG